jgi:chemotaxis protein CheD
VKRGPSFASSAPTVVGLGEAAVASARASQPEHLAAYGLGSCVALCLFDPASGLAGMAHIVLPGSDPDGEPNPKFAGSALPALVARMQEHGGSRDARRYQARLVGGALVLDVKTTGRLPRIGELNALAVQDALVDAGLSVQGFDVGGSRGRSVWFDPRDGGRVRVRVLGSPERYV